MPLPPELKLTDEAELRLIKPEKAPCMVADKVLSNLETWCESYRIPRKLKTHLRGKLSKADRKWLEKHGFIDYQAVKKIIDLNPRVLYPRVTRIYLPYYRNALYFMPEILKLQEDMLLKAVEDHKDEAIVTDARKHDEEQREIRRIRQVIAAVKLSKRFGLLTASKMTNLTPQAITAASRRLQHKSEAEVEAEMIVEFYSHPIILEPGKVEAGQIGEVEVKVPKSEESPEIPPENRGWHRD